MHLGCPSTNPLDLHELIDHLLIVQLCQSVKIKLPTGNVLC